MMQRFRSLFLATTILFSFAAQVALADNTLNSINQDTVFFDPSDLGTNGTSACTVSDVNLLGSDNLEKAYHYFVDQNMTPAQSAGLVSNLQAESGVIPTAQQDKSSDPLPKNGVGFGIAQWTFSGRQEPLVAYAESLNQPVISLAVQLGFVWKELNTNYPTVLASLKATSDPAAAADIVMNGYEIPQYPAIDGPPREQGAKQILALYGGQDATLTSSNPASSTTTTNGCDVAGNSQFIDGFTVYSQYDPTWKNLPYGSSTIGTSGCGPSSMAMIITALTGNRVTPVETADYAGSHGLYIPGSGSSWSIGPVLATQWGLKSQAIGANVNTITTALKAGQLVIAAGEGPLPFTSGGHFIVIRAITADGQFKVGDPGHDNTSTQSWNPQQLVNSMNNGSVYAISK